MLSFTYYIKYSIKQTVIVLISTTNSGQAIQLCDTKHVRYD